MVGINDTPTVRFERLLHETLQRSIDETLRRRKELGVPDHLNDCQVGVKVLEGILLSAACSLGTNLSANVRDDDKIRLMAVLWAQRFAIAVAKGVELGKLERPPV